MILISVDKSEPRAPRILGREGALFSRERESFLSLCLCVSLSLPGQVRAIRGPERVGVRTVCLELLHFSSSVRVA